MFVCLFFSPQWIFHICRELIAVFQHPKTVFLFIFGTASILFYFFFCILVRTCRKHRKERKKKKKDGFLAFLIKIHKHFLGIIYYFRVYEKNMWETCIMVQKKGRHCWCHNVLIFCSCQSNHFGPFSRII